LTAWSSDWPPHWRLEIQSYVTQNLVIDWLQNWNESSHLIKILSHSDSDPGLMWNQKLSFHRDLISSHLTKKILISFHKKKLLFWFCSVLSHDFLISSHKRKLLFWFCSVLFYERLILFHKDVILFWFHFISSYRSMISFWFWLEIRMRWDILILT